MKQSKQTLAGLVGLALAGSVLAGPQGTEQSEKTYEQQHQQVQSQQQDTTRQHTMTQDSYRGKDLTAMTPDELEGKKVVNTSGEEIGDIDSIKVETATQKKVAIVGIKGVTGAAAKEVAVPLQDLELQASGEAVQTELTKAQLESMPDVDPIDGRYEEAEEAE